MVRCSLIFLGFLFSVSGLLAQDLIVTNSGDSLKCQIQEISGDLIHITFTEDSVEKKAVISMSAVRTYIVDYQNNWEDVVPPADEPTHPKYRVSVGGGLSEFLGRVPNNIPQSLKAYVEELKSGNHFAADLGFYLQENLGLGLKYSLFKTKNQKENISIIDSTGAFRFGNLKDDITVQYFGPSLIMRQSMPNGGAHVVGSISFGLLTYLNNATVIDKFKLVGSTLAFSGDIGLDFQLEGGFHLGVVFGLTFASIKELVISGNGTTQSVNLTGFENANPSRFDLGVGLRYFL